jgi:hypothetical protein
MKRFWIGLHHRIGPKHYLEAAMSLHDAIQAAVTWIIGTVLVVILAALIIQWIRIETTRKQPRPQLDASPAPQP